MMTRVIGVGLSVLGTVLGLFGCGKKFKYCVTDPDVTCSSNRVETNTCSSGQILIERSQELPACPVTI